MALSELRVSEEQYTVQDRTFHGFVHMAAFFVLNVFLVLLGLFLFGEEHLAVLGLLVGLGGPAALVYGAATAGDAAKTATRRDLEQFHALNESPERK